MRVLICGGRSFEDRRLFHNTIFPYYEKYKSNLEIITGMARGADTLALKFGLYYQLSVHKFPAEWDVYGKSAGYIRNKQMLDIGKPDLVVAFPGGNGTKMMIKLAKDAGVQTKEV